jgi:hypothetical protein
VLGPHVHYAGPSGAGSIVKLVNNVMSMGNVLVAAEAFVLGVRAGMEPQRLLEILRTSVGRSYHFEKRFPNILARNFAPGFTVDLARKDLGLAVDMARSHDARCRRRACCTSSTTPAPPWAKARATSRPSSSCTSRGRGRRCRANQVGVRTNSISATAQRTIGCRAKEPTKACQGM